ncbi:hypothetical protein HHI36_002472 [Cryptolaemus montrouzieri]|uniref:CHK kinase-like domain-containing protein n=1 Tax=Cryptolaemus montrouzieri TaxID=559131 RepID=A0ABD2PC49_9CUCU
MSAAVSKRQKQLIHEIATEEGFKTYKVDFDQGSLKGDGYMGTIILVKIEDAETQRVLHLILKVAQQSEQLREKTPVCQAYERENFMYEVVHKEFQKLQDEYKVQPTFDGIPKYYKGLNEINEECLVLENLKEIGFKLWDRKKPMDSNHVAAVMAQYGKYHALSHALKKLKPEKYKEISGNLFDIFEKTMNEEDFRKSVEQEIEKAKRTFENDPKIVEVIQKFPEISQSYFKGVMEPNEKDVIIHGDCWCNNIMFKYGIEPNKPSKTYLLDWQLSSKGSPLRDITYFFYVCSSKECFSDYKTYLKIYHDSLSNMLQNFGLNVEDIMTFEYLQTEWKKFAQFGMYTALLLIKIMLVEKEEAPDLKEMLEEEENKNIIDFFNFNISNEEEYKNRLRVIIDFMVENEFV